MFDKYQEYISYFKDHALTFPLLFLLVSILTGITLSQLVFFRLRSLAARVSGDYYPLLQRAMRGIPVLWGILAGGYVAIQIITLPAGILHLLDITFQVILIFSLTIMGSRLISGFIALQLQKSAGNFASTSILVNTIELVVYLTGFLFMLQSFGVSIAPLLTALGVGGLAVALALQDTLSNLFSGINILLSKQTKVGDYIKLSSGEEGIVADMNWRSTTIQQTSNNMVVVPNQKIATSIITNYALPDAECSLVVPVSVSYDSDLDHVEQTTIAVAKEVLQATEGAVKDFDPFIRYAAFAESSIQFNVILRIKNVLDQHLIRHELIKRLHIRYRQEGIEIPFPVRTVKIQKEGGTP